MVFYYGILESVVVKLLNRCSKSLGVGSRFWYVSNRWGVYPTYIFQETQILRWGWLSLFDKLKA